MPSSCIADDWCGCFKPGSACGVLNNLTSQQVQDMQDIKASMRVKQLKSSLMVQPQEHLWCSNPKPATQLTMEAIARDAAQLHSEGDVQVPCFGALAYVLHVFFARLHVHLICMSCSDNWSGEQWTHHLTWKSSTGTQQASNPTTLEDSRRDMQHQPCTLSRPVQHALSIVETNIF